MITPGTNLAWFSLEDWIAAAQILERRRCARSTDLAMAAHWRAFPARWIASADAPACLALAAILGARPTRAPWEKPRRGLRAGRWADCLVATNNRLAQIARELDQASIGRGHNSQERRAA